MYKQLSFALALAALTSCGGEKPKDKKSELEQLRKEQAKLQDRISALEKEVGGGNEMVDIIRVGKPEQKVFKHFLEVQGKVESDQNVSLSAKVPSTVIAVNVQRGDEVRKGQVLIQLDDAIVRQGTAELQNAMELANTVYDKQKRLWEQKIGTEIQYLQAKNNKASLEKKMATLNEQLAMYRITSPINGSVDDITPKLGELVAPGMPLVRVVNFDKTKITAEVSEAHISKVSSGNDVIISFPDQNKDVKSKVRVASKAINPVNRTFTIELPMPGGGVSIHPNMIAIVRVNDYTNPKAITVPLNVVQKDEKGAFVYVAEGKNGSATVAKKYVKQGNTYSGEAEILSGLTTEDQVITSGFQNVTEGQTVKIGG